MTLNCSFRPTAYRDLHLGGAWNAYLNWLIARRTGGEFVFVQDDLWMLLAGCWGGFPPDVAVERYKEDLCWLGMEPDRVEWGWRKPPADNETEDEAREREAYNQWRAERHEWAAEMLGHRKPILQGEMPVLGSPYALSFRADAFDDKDTTGVAPPPGCEGQSWNFLYTFSGYHMACCVVDDIDFRIGAWAAGKDQQPYAIWCLDAYYKLGYNPPLMMFHPTLKRAEAPVKISKSEPPPSAPESTIRNLRANGYTAEEILDTLRECSYRAYQEGLEQVIIPHGILECETKGILHYANPGLGPPARGEFDPSVPEELRAYMQNGAQQRLSEGYGTLRTP